jgi:hypothetical protein
MKLAKFLKVSIHYDFQCEHPGVGEAGGAAILGLDGCAVGRRSLSPAGRRIRGLEDAVGRGPDTWRIGPEERTSSLADVGLAREEWSDSGLSGRGVQPKLDRLD